MFSVKFTLAVLAAVSASNALSIPHNHRSLSTLAARKEPPAGWWTEGLEDYDTYHTRYLAISCHTQHDTQFFDDCCHPMLKTENLVDNRKAYCTPSESASSSASAAEPTSTVDTGDEGTDEPDNLAVDNGNNNNGGNNNNDDEGDDDEEEWDCDDEDDGEWDEPASASVSASVDEPKPTSTKEAEPTTTKEADPEPTSESQPEPTSGGDNNGGNGAYPGQITWYEQGGVAGACGDMHSDSDYIAAVSFSMYGNIGAKSGLCGQKLQITNPANKNSITVTIADACQSCEDTHIDLSTGAFNALADPNLGLVDVSIKWL